MSIVIQPSMSVQTLWLICWLKSLLSSSQQNYNSSTTQVILLVISNYYTIDKWYYQRITIECQKRCKSWYNSQNTSHVMCRRPMGWWWMCITTTSRSLSCKHPLTLHSATKQSLGHRNNEQSQYLSCCRVYSVYSIAIFCYWILMRIIFVLMIRVSLSKSIYLTILIHFGVYRINNQTK